MAGVAMSRGRARGPTGHAHGVAYLAAAHVLGHAAQAWAHENTVPAVPRNTDRDSRESSWTGDASPLETYATDCQLPMSTVLPSLPVSTVKSRECITFIL